LRKLFVDAQRVLAFQAKGGNPVNIERCRKRNDYRNKSKPVTSESDDD
jgi:hypothetical protein